MPVKVFPASFLQESVQFSIRSDFRQGRHEIALHKADVVFDPAFLMPLGGVTKEAFEQIVTAEAHKGLLFLTVMAFQDLEHRCFQVIVGDPVHHPAKKVEGADMAFEKCFLFLHRKGHHEAGFGVIQPQNEQVDRDPLPGNDRIGFAPIHLTILPRIEFEGQEALALFSAAGAPG